jgi:hypothetical protein
MELLNLMKKSFTGSMKWVVILAFVILCMLMLDYSRKYATFDNMENENNEQEQEQEEEKKEETSSAVVIPTASATTSANPSDLLPTSNSGQNGWDVLNSVGTTAGANPDLLEAGYHTGIDTIGQSLRNANLQLRSDPAIPLQNTGPWNQTTIEPTNVQVPFNLGQ